MIAAFMAIVYGIALYRALLRRASRVTSWVSHPLRQSATTVDGRVQLRHSEPTLDRIQQAQVAVRLSRPVPA